ncbi:hypothetical protein RND71_030093 [Anisodus tanguticus]|uniref:Uncharacterized protein n=1 Tax=Anisodus tanguticus TaxID=243964 RepID=A0AAE1REN0_9SOLA|nr:hypothetical protein RND71_030093 [Anisodus tanguticus]
MPAASLDDTIFGHNNWCRNWSDGIEPVLDATIVRAPSPKCRSAEFETIKGMVWYKNKKKTFSNSCIRSQVRFSPPNIVSGAHTCGKAWALKVARACCSVGSVSAKPCGWGLWGGQPCSIDPLDASDTPTMHLLQGEYQLTFEYFASNSSSSNIQIWSHVSHFCRKRSNRKSLINETHKKYTKRISSRVTYMLDCSIGAFFFIPRFIREKLSGLRQTIPGNSPGPSTLLSVNRGM